jgi:hypothetical protein
MYGKVALSLSVAALILAGGGFLALVSKLDRLDRGGAPGAGGGGRPPGVVPPDAPPGDPLQGTDLVAKTHHVIERLQQMEGEAYEYYTDLSGDLFAIKREVSQLKSTLRQVVQGLGRSTAGGLGFGWGLKPRGAPIGGEVLQRYREDAEKAGVKVEEGRVTVRGFLNFSPRADMPIEYFVTRFPEAGHETLVHLIGNKDLEALAENPYGQLKGLPTALYKGLVAAGFQEGEPTHPDPASDPRNPRWILATGDTVYLAVRYEREGKTHVALATDWVRDPGTDAVLPIDAFRFTGSLRGEDPDTGDELLASEGVGLLVTVWPEATALVQVALESSLRNDYAYHFSRIPKPEGEAPLYLDVIFSKTPVKPEGEGALPIERPAPMGSAPRPTSPAPPGEGAEDE